MRYAVRKVIARTGSTGRDLQRCHSRASLLAIAAGNGRTIIGAAGNRPGASVFSDDPDADLRLNFRMKPDRDLVHTQLLDRLGKSQDMPIDLNALLG